MIQFNSLECQDRFVYSLLGQQKNGFFLDVGCQTPIDANNTYLFETLGWDGLAFDRSDVTHWNNLPVLWNEKRKTKRFLLDATSAELTNVLLSYLPRGGIIVDYLSVDIDDNGGLNFGVEGLLRVLNAGITFKILTFEHEAYRDEYSNGVFVRELSRAILHRLDYFCLFPNVCLAENKPFEDWWIHPSYFDSSLLALSTPNLCYKECVRLIENKMGASE